MLIRNAKIYRNRMKTFLAGDLLIVDGLIRKVGKIEHDGGDVIDAEGAYVVPGLIDVHTHGRAGFDFVSASPHEYGVMARSYAERGVTTVMPTLASAPLPQMLRATDALNRFTPRAGEADFCGVHWEGRYLHPDKRGAHALTMLATPDPAELEAEVFRMCRSLHITVAAELDTDGRFAAKARSLGATLGLGHTTATYAQAKQAEERGITAYTHLFNAMPPLHHRDGGAVCAALEGDAFCELICDGIHVSPEMVRLAYRAKGCRRMSLISDSMEASGCADGEYAIAGLPVTVKDGVARTHEGALAGSMISVDEGVRNLMSFCRIPLTEAILCATETPAKEMGVFDRCGSLEPGKQADLLFLRSGERLDIERVMLRGNWLS